MLQSVHGMRDRRTDGQTDRRTDGVKPIYPPTTTLFGGYNNNLYQSGLPVMCLVAADWFLVMALNYCDQSIAHRRTKYHYVIRVVNWSWIHLALTLEITRQSAIKLINHFIQTPLHIMSKLGFMIQQINAFTSFRYTCICQFTRPSLIHQMRFCMFNPKSLSELNVFC